MDEDADHTEPSTPARREVTPPFPDDESVEPVLAASEGMSIERVEAAVGALASLDPADAPGPASAIAEALGHLLDEDEN